jgi:hypothetical protein
MSVNDDLFETINSNGELWLAQLLSPDMTMFNDNPCCQQVSGCCQRVSAPSM